MSKAEVAAAAAAWKVTQALIPKAEAEPSELSLAAQLKAVSDAPVHFQSSEPLDHHNQHHHHHQQQQDAQKQQARQFSTPKPVLQEAQAPAHQQDASKVQDKLNAASPRQTIPTASKTAQQPGSADKAPAVITSPTSVFNIRKIEEKKAEDNKSDKQPAPAMFEIEGGDTAYISTAKLQKDAKELVTASKVAPSKPVFNVRASATSSKAPEEPTGESPCALCGVCWHLWNGMMV
jgi:hypothetical protein